mmetsp:Transcript_26139/g.65864  ORF Transcript_26139/g.65864 Transcript_26139/m.65864 type:complete len:287 (-) Transcript_26139:236-1096(-)
MLLVGWAVPVSSGVLQLLLVVVRARTTTATSTPELQKRKQGAVRRETWKISMMRNRKERGLEVGRRCCEESGWKSFPSKVDRKQLPLSKLAALEAVLKTLDSGPLRPWRSIWLWRALRVDVGRRRRSFLEMKMSRRLVSRQQRRNYSKELRQLPERRRQDQEFTLLLDLERRQVIQLQLAMGRQAILPMELLLLPLPRTLLLLLLFLQLLRSAVPTWRLRSLPREVPQAREVLMARQQILLVEQKLELLRLVPPRRTPRRRHRTARHHRQLRLRIPLSAAAASGSK